MCVGFAFGAAKKIRAFVPTAAECAEADGMAILNFSNDGKTIIQIIISDFTPNTSYDLQLVTPGGLILSAGGVLVTDDKGHATAHMVANGLDVSDSDIFIYTDLGVPDLEILCAVGLQ